MQVVCYNLSQVDVTKTLCPILAVRLELTNDLEYCFIGLSTTWKIAFLRQLVVRSHHNPEEAMDRLALFTLLSLLTPGSHFS